MKVTAYKTPQEFLVDTERILERKELENNLILGLCIGFPNKTRVYNSCVFINSFDRGQIQATSIKTISKAIVSAINSNDIYIGSLANYYLNNQIPLSGVFGETKYAKSFSKYYPRKEKRRVEMIVHELSAVNSLSLASGHFEKANIADLDRMSEWTLNFQKEAEMPIKKSSAETRQDTQARIEKGVLFKWIDNGEIVSIAAVVRHTKNIGIVGLVYTPNNLRGKGYATSTVLKLSEHILQNGFKLCGLFTEKSNPTSNNIYKKIGYKPITEFADIEFE